MKQLGTTWFAIVGRGTSVAAAAMTVVLAGCGKKEAAPAAPAPRPVKMMTIGSLSGVVSRTFAGTVRAVDQSGLAFEVPGVLKELPAKDGMTVKKGDVVARLDDRDYQSAVLAAKAKFSDAKLQYERADTLVKAKAISQAEFDTKKAAFDVAQAELAKAEKSVEDTVLRAPFDGQVSSVVADNFQGVQAKQVIMNVKNLKNLEVMVYVPERTLLSSQTGTAVRMVVLFEDLPGKEFPVAITEFATDPDPATKTYAVKLAIDKPDSRILPGMTASVRLDARKRSGTIEVPAVAVVNESQTAPYVWVIDPATKKATRRTVTVGAMVGDQIAVTSGLKPGETIAISGAHFLREGLEVREMPKYE